MVQQQYTAPNDLLYSKKYWYKSGVNKTIKNDLQEIAGIINLLVDDNDVVIDIGANDGTLLSFVTDTVFRVGVEPADNLQDDLTKNCEMVVHSFWDKPFTPKAKVITAIGMFYDLDDPLSFVKNVAESLTDDGVFIAQLMTAKQMVQTNDVGNLCHEHLEFYDWNTLKYLFEKAGLEIFDVEENSINGGSYRLSARHWTHGHKLHIEQPIDWMKFYEDMKRNKELFLEYIQGRKVFVYGASTKGNTILQWYGLGPEAIKGAIDIDTDKHGKFTLTGIPIVDESHLQDASLLWCIPFGFVEQFRKQTEGLKVWVVTSPNFKVL